MEPAPPGEPGKPRGQFAGDWPISQESPRAALRAKAAGRRGRAARMVRVTRETRAARPASAARSGRAAIRAREASWEAGSGAARDSP